MKKLLAVLCGFALVGCGAINATTDMNSKMDKTNEKMDQTNGKLDEVKRLQGLATALEQMMLPANSTNLNPPTSLFPWARKVAEYANADELAELVFLWMKELNEQQPNPSDCPDDVCSPEVKARMQHFKDARYAGLLAVAGLATQEKTEQVVKNEIYGDGEFKDAAYVFLMARTDFIQVYQFDTYLFENRLTNVGLLEAAYKQATNIDYIVRLPFANKIGIKIYGMLDPERNVEETLDTSIAKDLWRKLNGKFTSELDQSTINPNGTTDPAEKARREAARKRSIDLKTKIEAFVKSWN